MSPPPSMNLRARRRRVVQTSAQNHLPLLLNTKKQKHDKQDMKCNETFEGKTTHQKNNNGTSFVLAKELGKVTRSFAVPRLALDDFSRNCVREDVY